MAKKNSLRRGFKTEAEKKSIKFRDDLGLAHHDALCGYDLAEYLRIPIIPYTQIPGLDDKYLNALTSDSKSWSAVTIPSKKDRYQILLNSCHASTRLQSNIMHELAHIICEHPFSKIGILREFPEAYEDEAIWLGGCLQIPRAGLQKLIYSRKNISQIAQHFNASEGMARYRINVTGLSKKLASR